MKTIEVVAAVIFNAEDKILIARRGPNKSLPAKWEFPGGKVESGETHQIALQRELKEEMNITIKAQSFLGSNLHHYSDISVHLHAYKASYISGEFRLSDHDLIKWVSFEELNHFDFAEADVPLISRCNPKT